MTTNGIVAGLSTHYLSDELTLIEDENADSFPNSFAVIRGKVPDANDYEDFWRIVHASKQLIDLPPDVLAYIVEKETGYKIN